MHINIQDQCLHKDDSLAPNAYLIIYKTFLQWNMLDINQKAVIDKTILTPKPKQHTLCI